MGAESKLKAAGGSGKENTRPRRVPQRQVEPPTPETSPPAGRVVCLPVPVPPGFSPGDARGEAPCIRKPKISPFPAEEGGWGGWGQESKPKAGLVGGCPPCAPAGYHSGRSSRQRRKQAPAGRVVCLPVPVPPGFSPRGCKGRSPLHQKTKNLPLPRRGRGGGGMGAESKLKAAGGSGKENTRPRRVPQRQVEPPTPETSPRRARGLPPCSSATRVQPPGMQGAKPLASENQKSPPSPEGKGGRGDGGRIKTKGGGGKRQGKHTPPPGTTAAGRAANAGNKPPRRARGLPPCSSAARVQPPGMQGAKPLA